MLFIWLFFRDRSTTLIKTHPEGRPLKCHWNRWWCARVSYAWGLVVWKISSMQAQVTSHTSGLNFSPFRITRFSRQFVPDRASCSLSENRGRVVSVTHSQVPCITTPCWFKTLPPTGPICFSKCDMCRRHIWNVHLEWSSTSSRTIS